VHSRSPAAEPRSVLEGLRAREHEIEAIAARDACVFHAATHSIDRMVAPQFVLVLFRDAELASWPYFLFRADEVIEWVCSRLGQMRAPCSKSCVTIRRELYD
jgi:hypothetical protein